MAQRRGHGSVAYARACGMRVLHSGTVSQPWSKHQATVLLFSSNPMQLQSIGFTLEVLSMLYKTVGLISCTGCFSLPADHDITATDRQTEEY